jgi:hypothetical protein
VFVSRNRTTPARALAPLAALAALLLGAACSEDLESDGGCPALCPQQGIVVQDTMLEPVALDTTLVGFPARGTEPFLLLATAPGLDVRAIVRFDTLVNRYQSPGDTARKPITNLDSLRLVLRPERTGALIPNPVIFEIYDVDTDDTTTAGIAALFSPERLIGSDTIALADTATTIELPLSEDAVLARMTAGTRLRLGIRAYADAPVVLRLFAVEQGGSVGPRILYKPDTNVRSEAQPISLSPRTDPQRAVELRDFTLVVQGTPPPPADAVATGGLPGRRGYLRFDLPRRILDSTTVVRASLELWQRPNPRLSTDTLATTVYPHVVLAGSAVTDPAKAALILNPVGAFGIDSLRVEPADSGRRFVQLTQLLRAGWRGTSPDTLPRALVLRIVSEGTLPAEVLFYSREAAVDSLRPRLRLSYIPRVDFGLP